MRLHAIDEILDHMLAVGRGLADQILPLDRGIADIGQRYPIHEISEDVILGALAEAHGVKDFAQRGDRLVAGHRPGVDLMLQLHGFRHRCVVDRFHHGGTVGDHLAIDEVERDRSGDCQDHGRQGHDRQKLGSDTGLQFHIRTLPPHDAVIEENLLFPGAFVLTSLGAAA